MTSNVSLVIFSGESGGGNGTFWGALRFFNERGMLKLKNRKAPIAAE
jgi:hypothetical protein